MYSDKESINILTSLLVAHGVRHAVVCPGSRNAPIVHNLAECPDIRCFPVTDERSAGFFALGIAQTLRQPVVVCVTSGSAMLNVAPAVAEAFYQQLPLVVVTADRPEAWIDQLDGQTIRQVGALANIVGKEVALPSDIRTETERWHCNRMVNEALLATSFPKRGPVHINVPIDEPLFEFNTPELPHQRVIRRHVTQDDGIGEELTGWLFNAERPMVIVGQYNGRSQDDLDPEARYALSLLSQRVVLLSESLCSLLTPTPVDEALAAMGADEAFQPDVVVYLGGMLVSKRLRHFLRRLENARVVMVSPDGAVSDVSMHTTDVVAARDAGEVLLDLGRQLAEGRYGLKGGNFPGKAFVDSWKCLFARVESVVEDYEPSFSQSAVVKYMEQQLEDLDMPVVAHYANSSAVRLANVYALHHVFCNRGVNGIEGSLSTAVGCAAVNDAMVLCVVGDLSFFYDQNALWNHHLKGNLRIVLLNNAKGGIFHTLPGLEHSAEHDAMVCGAHQTNARGICAQCDVGYLHADNEQEMRMGVVTLLTRQSSRPMLLEVFTDPRLDAAALKAYMGKLL